ncbi:MAG: cellulase family glycosylhydrolase [Candidatus Lokiarchaeota archaeon]|nr:cellulase family glycosylhydrolase [Candidatus Lokiarchaeota archaeon]
MKHRKITTVLILIITLMGFFLTMNINLSTSEPSISKTPDSITLSSSTPGLVRANPISSDSMVLNSKTHNIPSLEVRGKWITDALGNEVQLRGVSVTELQAIYEGHRSHARPTSFEDIIDFLDVYGFKVNTIRLPMHPWVDDETGPHGWVLDYNSEIFPSTRFFKMSHNDYFNLIIDPAVQYCVSKGYYVILDWHGMWGWGYNDPLCLAETVEFWNYMCGKYANNSAVLFELWNEPHGGGDWLSWMPYAQGMIDAIRSGNWSQYQPLIDQVNDVRKPTVSDRDICRLKYNTTGKANNIILVGGPHYNQILPHSGNILWDTEPYDESLFFTGGNIAYVLHLYPAHGVTNMSSYTARFRPVVVTEWGYEAEGPNPTRGNSFWGYEFKEFFQGWPNIGWIAWCFDYIYHSHMFDCEWNLLGNGVSDSTTRYHDNQCIYINTIPNVEDKQFRDGFDTEPDTYDNYFGYFVKDWLDELEPAPIIRPTEDISIDVDSTGNSITWIVIDENPTTYTITQDGTQVDSGFWGSGNPITINVDGLSEGSYNYTCTVNDGDGISDSKSLTLTVVPVSGGDVWFSSVHEKTVGDTFETEIYVDTGSQNLGNYEFDITYNEDVIQIASDEDIEPISEGFVSEVNIDNVNGLVTIVGFDKWGIGPSSQIHLLTITWTAVGEGISPLDLTIDTLLDTDRNTIDIPNDIDGSVVVDKAPVITPILIGSPNVYYQEGTTGHSISWIAIDDNPTSYTVTRDGTQVASDSWSSGVEITLSVDGLSEGTYRYTCTVNDEDGMSMSYLITVYVVPVAAGNVWISSVSTQTVGDTFETEIYVNTGSQNLGAYELIILNHNPQTGTVPIQIASNNDIVAGSEGFVSEVNIFETYVTIAGFNEMGTGPSSQLHLLTITWTAVGAGSCPLRIIVRKLVDTDLNNVGTPKGVYGKAIIEEVPEIAPILNSPLNVYYQEDTTGHSITWIATGDNSTTYTVTQDGIQVASGSYSSGDSITVSVDDLSDGYHTYTCTVYNGDGLSNSDSVRVRVVPVTVGNVWFSSVSTQTVGDTFETEIYINTGSQKLGCYGFDITYNKDIIQIASANDIVAGSEGFINAVNLDNANGLVKICGFEPMGTGPNSQLHVLTITWTAIGVGYSSLDLSIIDLTDNYIITIGNSFDIDGSVVVEAGPVKAPVCISSSDVFYQFGETGNAITWIAIDDNPTTYTITQNGTQVASDFWSSGVGITVSVDGLSEGSYIYTCTVNDGDGLSDSDSVTVTVGPVTGGDVWFSSVSTQTVGDTFETEIYVDTGSHNLYYYSFNITYDESVIQIASINDIVAGSEGFVSEVNIFETYVTIVGFNVMGTGPSSQLHLLTITWTAVGIGYSSLDLSIELLVDMDTNTIGTPNAIDGSVDVEEAPTQVPELNSPTDVYYKAGETGNSITWIATDDNPTTYTITQNGTIVTSGSWSSGDSITVSIDGLSVGIYQYTCTVNDGSGNNATDSVYVIVDDAVHQDGVIPGYDLFIFLVSFWITVLAMIYLRKRRQQQ